MASTSTLSNSSPFTPRWTYDVFLSFRGEDTRNNFTDHLYTALVQRGIRTFRDDQLRRGEKIAPELLKAIEESRSSIVVFSKTYADSRWCLDELAKIMECRREYTQIVLPIFYHVDPSDVRKQTGSFGEAFTKYEESWKNKAARWREALTEAGNISGWHINEGYESEHIKKITTTIANRILNRKLLFVEDNLVGMDSHFKKIGLGLSMESNDIRMVGICGIGGIGKTTIAGYIYNQISWGFEYSSYLEKVKEVYKNKGLLHLQNQLLNDILDGGNQKISNVHQGAYVIKNSLYFRKALIVFDDVDDMDQLEFLVGNHNWYGKGSRIIITTRDKHWLTMLEVDYLYEVEGLNCNEALKLFSQFAFRSNLPKEEFKNLLSRVIDYCQGHPLALKVLGSLLCGKTMHEWESELHKLRREPEGKIQNVLKISFDGLDRTQKKIFLDIACFFEGEDRDFASKILDGCDLYGERGIGVLQERCLITISGERIYMHDLIQQMGWEIIREQNPEDPSKWSRLWNVDDIYHAFISEKGMKNVETISLELSRSKEIWFTTKIFAQMKKVFAKMKKLRLLKVYYSDHYSHMRKKYKISLPEGFEFPPGLRYLHWEGLESLPSNFEGENLVAINLKSSNIRKLWKGKKHHEKLKFVDVSDSQQLIKLPNFSSMPNLERLNLQGCTSFRKLRSSIGAFPHMKFFKELHLCGVAIKEVPSSIGSLTSLEILDLSECSKFQKVPDIFTNMRHLRELYLRKTGIKELPSSVGYLESLESLNLSGCSNFEKFPEIQENMKCLKNLILEGTAIKELPNNIGYLKSLEAIYLTNSSKFEKFPEILGNMKCLKELYLESTAIKELPNSIGCLEALQNLSLQNTPIKELPSSIGCLKALEVLFVDDCSNLEKFPEIQRNMESLKNLSISGTAIKELPYSIGHLIGLNRLNLENCKNLRTLPTSIHGLKYLENLSLNGCSSLEAFSEIKVDVEHSRHLYLREIGITELPSTIERLQGLKSLELIKCENLETLPNSIGNLTCLSRLFVRNCSKLHKLPDNLRSLQYCLTELDLAGCNLTEEAIPSDLWCLSSLESLDVSENRIRCIPVGIIQLSKLIFLGMNHCPMLEEISELPSSLRMIQAHGCPGLKDLSCDPTDVLWFSLLNYFKSDTENLKCERDFYKTHCNISVVIPGSSGIPEWVSNKSTGCEIRIELPKNWYKDDNFLGFALFFHHLPLDDDDDDERDTKFYFHQCELSISYGDQSEQVDSLWLPFRCRTYNICGLAGGTTNYDFTTYEKGSTTDPALVVSFFPQIGISSEYRSKRWNSFKARFKGSYRCGDNEAFKVKSCGIHLIYAQAQDHRQKRSKNDDLTEEDPHHKRSRYV